MSKLPVSNQKEARSDANIANEIANEFYEPTSLFHADLRRKIIKALQYARVTQTQLLAACDLAGEDTLSQPDIEDCTPGEILVFYTGRIFSHLGVIDER